MGSAWDGSWAITDGQLETKTKSNTFGKGYANGGRVTVGCSKKGRVWSYKVAHDVSEWIDWCAEVGRKLIDPSIVPREIFLHNVLLPRRITERPDLVPIVIEWSEEFYRSNCSTRLEFGIVMERGRAVAGLG